MDAVMEWVHAQARVVELVDGLSTEALEVTVPACPGWTARQLVAHMIGVDADILAGRGDDGDMDGWTQSQVDARQDQDLDTLLAEWRAMTVPVEEWMRANNTRPLGDVIIHEQDLRGALDVPGARETDGLAALRDRMAEGFDQAVSDAGLAPVHLISDAWTHETGTGEPGLVLIASEFDLTRAMMTRRSAAQLDSYVTAGELEPYLPCFAALGELPTEDLHH
jgi:uncharacterized protein (TIGR03083 family)